MSDINKLYLKLLECANELREIQNTTLETFPEAVTKNVDAAIVYMDCARQQIIESEKVKE